jgi:hypothetical protein
MAAIELSGRGVASSVPVRERFFTNARRSERAL